MHRLAAAIILAMALNADWAVAEGICDFLVNQPKSATVSGVIVRGPWKIGPGGGFKYGMELEDKAEGSCGFGFRQQVMVFTNQSIAKCNLGREATAIGPGKLQWAPPGIPVYNMNGAKVKCQ